jgi:hypothetical protein
MVGPVIPPEILLEGSLSPRRLVKRKALLEALTASADPPAPAPAPARAAPATTDALAKAGTGEGMPVEVALSSSPPVGGAATPLPGHVLRQPSSSAPLPPTLPSSAPRILPVPFFTAADDAGAAAASGDLLASASTASVVRRARSGSTSMAAAVSAVPATDALTAASAAALPEEGSFHAALVDRLLGHLLPGFSGSRTVTLSVAIAALLELVYVPGERPVLLERHLRLFARMDGAARAYVLRYLDNAPDVFLDMFEEMARTVHGTLGPHPRAATHVHTHTLTHAHVHMHTHARVPCPRPCLTVCARR